MLSVKSIFFKVTLLLLLLLSNKLSYAQNQASIWYLGNGNGIDFNFDPPKVIKNTYQGTERISTISDEDGNLLFYCSNSSVWNSNHQLMENGTELNGALFSDIAILQKPESASIYYIFHIYEDPFPSYSAVIFSVVDLNENDGKGKVISKNEVLYSNLHGSFTITGNCETGYWLLGETNTNQILTIGTDQLLAFQIDENGVSKEPVISQPHYAGHFGNLRFSPNGRKLFYFHSGSSSGNSAMIADFSLETGKVDNSISLGYCCGSGEFSADGNFLYVTNESTDEGKLLQYDLRNPDYPEQLIASVPYLASPQLANDGKIYFIITISREMAVINHPDRSGIDCDFEIGEIFNLDNELGFWLLPTFATHLLYKGPDRLDAGPDIEVCSGESVQIGGINPPLKDYEWFPQDNLSNPYVSNPFFSYDNPFDSTVTFIYQIKTCEQDKMNIKVHPKPKPTILGSYSVCPKVQNVDYWTDFNENYIYNWSVNGGDIVAGQSTDSIKVNWGITNPFASVKLQVNNQFNCPTDTLRFPVRINVELQTQTPLGEDLLCANLGSGIPYGITNTNGSVYTWESDAGKIINGQGSNKVTVDWPGDGLYHIWVKEQSTTIDTVCYGVSDSLSVNLFADLTNLELDFVGIRPDDKTAYELQWYVSDTTRLSEDISIYASQDFTHDSELITLVDKKETYYSYADTSMNFTPMSFKIASVNGCSEKIESEMHTAIFLSGTADSVDNSMSLQWTPYLGWGNNIMQYEILYHKDDDLQFSLVASLPPGQSVWSNNWGDEAFLHHYRIRAIHASYPFESWSNELTLSFEHSFEIPNVFTPNGDGINDTFSFPELELFHENELTVIDRYGKEVFTAKNYNGHWNGAGLASGTYYYSFQEYRYGKSYKGWVQILR